MNEEKTTNFQQVSRTYLAPPLLADSLNRILSEIQFKSEGTVLVQDRTVSMRGRPKARVIHRLQNVLYDTYHACQFTQAVALSPDTDFVDELKKRHRITYSVEQGWEIVSGKPTEGHYIAVKDGLQLTIEQEHHIVGSERPKLGDVVSLHFPPERPRISPGYFALVSGVGCSVRQPSSRFYCNLKSFAAAEFLDRVTDSLEARELSYSMKILHRPEHYGRRDSAVIYANLTETEEVQTALLKVMAELGDGVNDETPPLAQTLARGLAFAQEPQQRDVHPVSFGQHRCKALAEAIWITHRRRCVDLGSIVPIVRETLINSEIDPMRPYLNLRR